VKNILTCKRRSHEIALLTKRSLLMKTRKAKLDFRQDIQYNNFM